MTWDDDDQDRVTFTRRHLTAEQIEDNDFRAYLASSGESEDGDDEPTVAAKKDGQASSAKEAERKRLRSLLLGDAGGGGDFFDDDAMPEGWGGSGKNKAGDLEITFAPGLTEGADGVDGVVDEENMTTIDRYKKKMQDKKQARTAKWEKNKEAREKGEEPIEEPAIARDDFFEADSEEDMRLLPLKTKGKSIYEAVEPALTKEVRNPSTAEELALLAADVHASGNEPRHFDMAKVIKAEKDKSKKKLHKKKGKGAAEVEAVEEEMEREDGEGFEINVNDERFKAMHEQHEFAIDPSNPQYVFPLFSIPQLSRPG